MAISNQTVRRKQGGISGQTVISDPSLRSAAAPKVKELLAATLRRRRSFAGVYVGTDADGGACVVVRRTSQSALRIKPVINGVPIIQEVVEPARGLDR